jgi:hypothetical protein
MEAVRGMQICVQSYHAPHPVPRALIFELSTFKKGSVIRSLK